MTQTENADQKTDIAQALCRATHSTRWEYRATSSPCDECVTGAGGVVDLLRGRLTSDDVIAHIQNWVPLGYDPKRDPYLNTHEAARAILAETLTVLITSPASSEASA